MRSIAPEGLCARPVVGIPARNDPAHRHEAINDYDDLSEAIAVLGGNVEVAVDDAGSGYVSLRNSQALRPRAVKL